MAGKRKDGKKKVLTFLCAVCLLIAGYSGDTRVSGFSLWEDFLPGFIRETAEAALGSDRDRQGTWQGEPAEKAFELSEIPPYQGKPYVVIRGNRPDFSEDELITMAFEDYSPLDSLGRCGRAYANICPELMPTEKRGPIGQIKPSGWHTVRYDDVIDKKYLYNRCHLIGYQLSGENANPRNLITGTSYLNAEGMLPFENQVANYVKTTGNHVLYRVAPIFRGNDLLAEGVRMEALSVEDRGRGICFHVFCYNVQPGIRIDYATGRSRAE